MKPTASKPTQAPQLPGHPQRRVEVRVEVEGAHEQPGRRRRQVVLRDMSFGEGIGWYTQKTIRLDPEQVDALMRALCCAKQGCAQQPCAPEESAPQGNTVGARILQLSRLRSE